MSSEWDKLGPEMLKMLKLLREELEEYEEEISGELYNLPSLNILIEQAERIR